MQCLCVCTTSDAYRGGGGRGGGGGGVGVISNRESDHTLLYYSTVYICADQIDITSYKPPCRIVAQQSIQEGLMVKG